MTNLFEYEYGGKVRITDVKGNVFIGQAEEVTDVADRSDLEPQEVGITIAIDDKTIELFQSEISAIESI